jgi:hypothetical protein
MRKILDNHSAKTACLASLGAALFVGSSTPAFAQNRACQVEFDVTNATTLRSLQFDVNYTDASDVGEFVNPSDCTFAPVGLGDVGVNQATNVATVGWANTNPAFVGPGLFVTCRFDIPLQASAVPALADFAVANVEGESSTGVPAAPAPTIAAAAISCTDAGSCASEPLAGCKLPTAAGKAQLKFKDNADDTKDQGQFQWKSGAATLVTEFGTPNTAGETYSWCVYKDGALLQGTDVPAAGTCDGKPCWKASGTTGFQFKGDVGGIAQIKLKAGEAGKAQVQVKARSKVGNYSAPTIPLASTNVVSQLVVDDGVTPVCFQSSFPLATKDENGSYGAKGNP